MGGRGNSWRAGATCSAFPSEKLGFFACLFFCFISMLKQQTYSQDKYERASPSKPGGTPVTPSTQQRLQQESWKGERGKGQRGQPCSGPAAPHASLLIQDRHVVRAAAAMDPLGCLGRVGHSSLSQLSCSSQSGPQNPQAASTEASRCFWRFPEATQHWDSPRMGLINHTRL